MSAIAELDVVAEGLRYPEGPIAMADGSVLVVEINGGSLTRVRPNGELQVIAELGGSPNGAAIGPDGAVYVCNNGRSLIIPDNLGEEGAEVRHNPEYVGGSIMRVDLATGACGTLYDAWEGHPLESPNDIVFDSAGGFWFTCFGHSDGESRRMGGVFYAQVDGSQIRRLRHDQVSPNGIALSPGGGTLYWSDTMLQKIWATDILAPGEIGPPSGPYAGRPVLTFPGLQWPDGMAVEQSGRLCVATLFEGGIAVVEPAAGTHENVPLPDMITTNIAFGGRDMRDAWITGSSTGSLYSCRWPRPGLAPAFGA